MKKGDFVVIAAVLILSILCLLPFLRRQQGRVATVSLNGQVLYTIDISDPQNEGKSFTVSGKYTNEILVEGGSIAVTASDCPDKSCVKSGAINSSNSVICCLPNQLIISVSNNTEAETDVISG